MGILDFILCIGDIVVGFCIDYYSFDFFMVVKGGCD